MGSNYIDPMNLQFQQSMMPSYGPPNVAQPQYNTGSMWNQMRSNIDRYRNNWSQYRPDFSNMSRFVPNMSSYMPSVPSMPNVSQQVQRKPWLKKVGIFVGLIICVLLLVVGIKAGINYASSKSVPTSSQRVPEEGSDNSNDNSEGASDGESGGNSSGESEDKSPASKEGPKEKSKTDDFTWYYYVDGVLSEPMQGCNAPDGDEKNWIMKNAYVSGRLPENYGWKYTDDPNDPECMRNWTYYDKDYNVVERGIKSITKAKDTKNWCAKPVYKPGGKQGIEWDYCS